MKKYICIDDRFFSGSEDIPVKGQIYTGDYTWGTKSFTVEEIYSSGSESFELVEEEPKSFSIEAKNIHMYKAIIDDLESIGSKALAFAKEQMDLFNKELGYVPFTFEDRDQFRDRWIRNKAFGFEYKIIGIVDNTIKITGYSCTYEQAFKEFTFIDGTPFGKLK